MSRLSFRFKGMEFKSSFSDFSYDCSSCNGFCCSLFRLNLTAKDIRRIGKKFPESIDGRKIRKRKDLYCWFFREGRCSIHELKPESCLDFPLTIGIATDGSVRIDRRIICPPSGKKIPREEIKERAREMFERDEKQYSSHIRRLGKGCPPILRDLKSLEKKADIFIRESLNPFDPRRLYFLFYRHSGGRKGYESVQTGRDYEYIQPILSSFLLLEGQKPMRRARFSPSHAFVEKKKIDPFNLPEIAPTPELVYDYLSEVLRRATTSCYLLGSAGKGNVWTSLGYLLFLHMCGLRLFSGILAEGEVSGPDFRNSIRNVEFSLSGRIWDYLCPESRKLK